MHPVEGIVASLLEGQEEAFKTCLSFLQGVEKTKRPHKWRGSYNLKHIVENPAGRFGIPSSLECYTVYVYEGTFILAALASGFIGRRNGKALSVTFNVSERSLCKRAKDWAAKHTRNCIGVP